jgi:cobalt transporter subunit CbtA
MFKRMFVSAVVAGGAAGFLAAALHFAFLQDRLLLAEQYESGALIHFQAAPAMGHDHAAGESADHDDAATGEAGHDHSTPQGAVEEDGHSHSHEPSGGSLGRNGLTVMFDVLVYVGFAMLLIAGFGAAEATGRRIGALEGILWGLGGFAAIQLAPAMGLAPELPGTPAAPLAARQVWWWMTVISTAGGLGLLAYGRNLALVAAGVVLLAAPHLIGAPEADGYAGVAPPELAAEFAARALGIGAIAWAFLGWLAGRIWSEQPA